MVSLDLLVAYNLQGVYLGPGPLQGRTMEVGKEQVVQHVGRWRE